MNCPRCILRRNCLLRGKVKRCDQYVPEKPRIEKDLLNLKRK